METLEFDHNIFSKPDGGDDSLFVVFYQGTMKNHGKSEAEGRLIVDDVECVRIIVPGDKNSVVDRPASPQDKARFSKQYAMFRAGHSVDEQLSGTRLTDWPHLSRGQCEELGYFGIKTVEQLAAVRDDIVGRVPGLTTLKQTAGIWLANAKGGAEAAATQKRLTDQDSRIAQLEKIIREQADREEASRAQRA